MAAQKAIGDDHLLVEHEPNGDAYIVFNFRKKTSIELMEDSL